MQDPLLFVVAVIFGLSLSGAFVLFKLLKSSAVIKRKEYQAGGALAGFLLVFGVLYASYSQLDQRAASRDVPLWTIVGEVTLADDSLNSAEVEVSFLPPSPKTLSAPGGGFRFDQVGMTTGDVPELQFELSGYVPQPLLLNESVADFDDGLRRITLRVPVVLRRIGTEQVGTATDPINPDAATLSGSVLRFLRQRSPLSGALVELRLPGSDVAVHHTFSDGDGNYNLQNIAPGEYDLAVRLGTQALDVIAPRSATVVLETRQSRTLIITVTMPERD